MKVYLKAWFTCQCPTSAPRNDLSLLRPIEAYKTWDESVAKEAVKSFSSHLWYLSETLIGLAFFDADVSIDEKVNMVRAHQREVPSDNPPRRIVLEDNKTAGMNLSDFVSRNTRQFFVALGVNQDFLEKDPSTWNTNDGYIQAQTKARQLKVVNDTAERNVALSVLQWNPHKPRRTETVPLTDIGKAQTRFSRLQQVNGGPDSFEALTVLLVMPYNMY